MTVIYQLNHFFKPFLRHFLLLWWLVNRAEDVPKQSLILRNLLSSNVFCPPPPPTPPPLTTQQVELIWMEMSTRHLFLKFFLFVFHLFSTFQKKKKTKNEKNYYPRPSTWYPRPSTWNLRPRQKNRLTKLINFCPFRYQIRKKSC